MSALEGALAVVAVVGMGAVLVWVWLPIRRGPRHLNEPDPLALRLLWLREATLATLRDLDADHAAGRIHDTVYQALRAKAVADGAATLAAIDQIDADRAHCSERLSAAIDAEVAQRSGRSAPGGSARDAVLRDPRGQRQCGGCGHIVAPGYQFCGRCGTPLGADGLEAP